MLKDNLPKYSGLSKTSNYKIKKYDIKKIGFNIKKTNNQVHDRSIHTS